MVILPASMFSFVLSNYLSFEGFNSNLLKNLKGAFPSRAPGSLLELSFKSQCQILVHVVSLDECIHTEDLHSNCS